MIITYMQSLILKYLWPDRGGSRISVKDGVVSIDENSRRAKGMGEGEGEGRVRSN